MCQLRTNFSWFSFRHKYKNYNPMWPFENTAKSNGFQFYVKKMGNVKVTQLEKANSIMSDLYINWDLPNKKISHTTVYGCDIYLQMNFTREFLSTDSEVPTCSPLWSAGLTAGPVSLPTAAKTWIWLPGKSGSSTFFLKIQQALQLWTFHHVSLLGHVLTAELLSEFTILLSYSGVTL